MKKTQQSYYQIHDFGFNAQKSAVNYVKIYSRQRGRERDDAPGITVAGDYSRNIISLKPKAYDEIWREMKLPAVETQTRYGLMSREITFSSVSAPVEGEQLLSKYEKRIFLVSKLFYCTVIHL